MGSSARARTCVRTATVRATRKRNQCGRGRVVTCLAVTRVMISGAPASGKGTQCEILSEEYKLTHISAGDLLRAEVGSGTANGLKAKEFMDAGKLVPNEIVVTMVKDRLNQPDAQAGWLLDGYPRSKDQADALDEANIRPEVFLLLEVPEEILVERVVGRRLDPETGKIYHLKVSGARPSLSPPPPLPFGSLLRLSLSPLASASMFAQYAQPESEEVEKRLIQRSDDTEEKVVPRLETHNANVAAILDSYQDVLVRINGNQDKNKVYADIQEALKSLKVST